MQASQALALVEDPSEALVSPKTPTSTELLSRLRAIPEETLWLEGQASPQTRRAYRSDVAGFMAFLGITTTDELRLVDRAAVLAWKRELEATSKPTTIRRKLAALTSLFTHLVERQVLRENPCRDIRRPKVNARQGTTPAFAQDQARAILDTPDPATLQGLRDRAILSVGFQAGPRRDAVVRLKVRDFQQDRGFDILRFVWKGGHEHAVALHPQTAQRVRDYLAVAGHGADQDGPLFRPLRRNGASHDLDRAMNARTVDRILKRCAQLAHVAGRHSAHSMRATFVTTALSNGASLEDVQAAAGHADPSTTKLYDRRGYNPEKSAAFFASY